MILGFLTAIIFLLVVSKFITKRCKNKKLDRVMGKVHKGLGITFLLICVVHLVSIWELRRQRPMMLYVLGFLMIALAIIAILCYIGRKALKKKWVILHRIAAGFVGLCLIGHVAYGFGSLSEYKQKVSEIQIVDQTATGIEDGVYVGEL